jgi:hypothetical protein
MNPGDRSRRPQGAADLREQIDMTNTTTPGETRTSPPRWPHPQTISGWLASGHPSPSTALREWDSAARLAMIPLGHTFDAVRIPAELVHAAIRSVDQAVVEARLSQYFNGPVIHDPGFRRYYALVPCDTARVAMPTGAECLSEGAWLGVPRWDRIDFDEETQASYWSVPLPRPGILCNAADVLDLVNLGAALTDDEDEK